MYVYIYIGVIDFMFKGKNWPNFQVYFHYTSNILSYKNGWNTLYGTENMYPQLGYAMQFRHNEISRIKDYFIAELHER